MLLATVAVGALPRRRLGTLAWCRPRPARRLRRLDRAQPGWTESIERTSADLARVAGYLGVFALALFSRGRGEAPAGWSARSRPGSSVVAVVALLSRLHPAWFPAATRDGGLPHRQRTALLPAQLLERARRLIAIGLPLLLQLATGARSALPRALAAAALPAMMLTLFFTLSRGGIAAAVLALAVFVALTSDRLPKLVTLLVAGAGGAILIVARDRPRRAPARAARRHRPLTRATRCC